MNGIVLFTVVYCTNNTSSIIPFVVPDVCVVTRSILYYKNVFKREDDDYYYYYSVQLVMNELIAD